MGEVVHCTHCRRPIAAEFSSCPFCKGEQPRRVAKPGPTRCATCKRPYNPALESCPFCAQQQAGYRGAAASQEAPTHAQFKQARAAIEEAESKLTTVIAWVVLGSVLSVFFAFALSSKIHAVGSGHLSMVGMIGFFGGAAAGLLGPRFISLEGPELGQRVTFFVGGWIAATAIGYLIVATSMLVTAGAPVRAKCTVSYYIYPKRSHGSPTGTRYTCTLPDGASMSGSEAHAIIPYPVGGRFTMEVRRAFGNWLYEPTSVTAASPAE